ncbi:hypothetical protein BDR05DRAFT_953627 [Suillus weaverae]|nr:hypothetical protein BDR05DRAFT_953627 [Suillus weaverae]
MPSDRKQVVILYAETKLQKSIDLSGSLTVASAKKEGMVAIRDHLNILPGVPPVSLDPECTDFYPVPKDDNVTIRSLKGNLTMVVYPEPPRGQHLTPSPFVDALQSAIREVRDFKDQQNVAPLIREERVRSNAKPIENDNLLRRFEAMEEKIGRDIAELRQEKADLKRGNIGLKDDIEELKRVNAGLQDAVEELRRVNAGLQDAVEELRRDNTGLKQDNTGLKRDNTGLKHDIKELTEQMDETIRAVLGDKVAIDKIRRRVLLDMGRQQLAVICGHKDWIEWKDSQKAISTSGEDFAIRTAMIIEAEVVLRDSKDASEYWKAVGRDHSTLRLLIHRNHIRTHANIAAHTSSEKDISESVLALTATGDRTHMIIIFRAVYNNEP